MKFLHIPTRVCNIPWIKEIFLFDDFSFLIYFKPVNDPKGTGRTEYFAMKFHRNGHVCFVYKAVN